MTMENLSRRINQFDNKSDARNLYLTLSAIYKRLGNVALTIPTLLTAGTTTKVKSTTDFYGFINGILVKKAATDNLITLTTASNCTNALFNVTMFTISSAGTITNRAGTAGATYAAITWPVLPIDEAIFGMMLINPTGTGDFIGGTTPVNDVTVVPNAVFISPLSALSFSAIANL